MSEAEKAVETLKEYKREDSQELTIKFFADDDSEGMTCALWKSYYHRDNSLNSQSCTILSVLFIILVIGRRLYGDGISLAVLQMLLFWNWFHWHLWTGLYETLTHDVYRLAVEHYKEIFGYWPVKFGAQKLAIVDDYATLWQFLSTNISSEEHDWDNWETALETLRVPLIAP